ncbi:hypothetical protein KKB44_03045 [Candidatus Micrarchaeota archaeon]|nr:hypothetical protein [Candidatus Micrarchaeota archaeon]
MYILEYDEAWKNYFDKLPPDIQKRFMKRRDKYKIFPTHGFRHEKYGLEFFVDEIGQYRVLFVSEERIKTRKFYFIGDHKEYEKFLGVG